MVRIRPAFILAELLKRSFLSSSPGSRRRRDQDQEPRLYKSGYYEAQKEELPGLIRGYFLPQHVREDGCDLRGSHTLNRHRRSQRSAEYEDRSGYRATDEPRQRTRAPAFLRRSGPPSTGEPDEPREDDPRDRTQQRDKKPEYPTNAAPGHPDLDGAPLFLFLLHRSILAFRAKMRERV